MHRDKGLGRGCVCSALNLNRGMIAARGLRTADAQEPPCHSSSQALPRRGAAEGKVIRYPLIPDADPASRRCCCVLARAGGCPVSRQAVCDSTAHVVSDSRSRAKADPPHGAIRNAHAASITPSPLSISHSCPILSSTPRNCQVVVRFTLALIRNGTVGLARVQLPSAIQV